MSKIYVKRTQIGENKNITSPKLLIPDNQDLSLNILQVTAYNLLVLKARYDCFYGSVNEVLPICHKKFFVCIINMNNIITYNYNYTQ